MPSFLAFDCIGPVLGFALVELMGTLKVGPMQSNAKNDVIINSKSERTSTVRMIDERTTVLGSLNPYVPVLSLPALNPQLNKYRER